MTNEPKDKWNVLVYQAGDNNLSGEMVWSLQEMAEVGASDRLALTAQFDPVGGPPRVLKAKKQSPGGLTQGEFPSLREVLEDVDKGEIEALVEKKKALVAEKKKALGKKEDEKEEEAIYILEFLLNLFREEDYIEASACPLMIEAFIHQHAQSQARTLLILSGHGNGAVGDFLGDTNPLSTLAIPELARLLKSVTTSDDSRIDTIDILGMDSCNMSMIEVCYEVQDSVEYLVGSEGFLLNCGWPYRRILRKIATASAGATPEDVAAIIAREYTRFYSDYTVAGVSVDIAAIHLSKEKMDAVVGSLKSLADALQDGLRQPENEEEEKKREELVRALLAAHWQAQSYKDEEYVDLWDFCHQLGIYSPGLADKTEAVKEAVRKAVAISCFSGPLFQHSHGLSIYLPWKAPDEVVEDYCKLSFSTASGWGNVIKACLEATRRQMRDDLMTGEKAEHVPALDETLFLIRRNPPYSKRNPPYSKRNPPYSKSLFARPSEVKNFPDTYYPSRCARQKNAKA